jgi:hypothetical protein
VSAVPKRVVVVAEPESLFLPNCLAQLAREHPIAAIVEVPATPLRVALRRSTCPGEPADVTAMPLGPPPGRLHVALRTLANDRVATITFTTSATRTKEYRQPEAGSLRQHSAWKLTLVRVQS